MPCNQGEGAKQLQSAQGSSNAVSFYINKRPYTVNTEDEANIGPQTRLVDFIRDTAGLKGTKFMCREGGCGACVVTVKAPSDQTVRSVNSCLTPVLSCDGWDITTVEGLGNRKEGYHPIQQRLVKFSGTQCGFCSSGMVMSMYSLTEASPGLKAKQIENNFDGNICRCTGYRPILDAFKSMAVDAPEELRKECADIEDVCKGTCPLRENNDCHANCPISTSGDKLLQVSGKQWVKATSLQSAFTFLAQFQEESKNTRLVAGNTGTGVFKSDTDTVQAFIDITAIPELRNIEVGPGGLVLGGGVTLSQAIRTLKAASNTPGFEYTHALSKHIKRIANVSVRNAGSLAGNLMIKHAHQDFPSDIFTILEASGAQLSISTSVTGLELFTLTEFLTLNMMGRIVISIVLKPLTTKEHIFRSFKITRRYQNSHAYVNGGFLFKLDTENNFTVMEKPRIVFGGIASGFSHARETEEFLNGKSLKSPSVLKEALEILEREVVPDASQVDGSVEYRKRLTQSLLYKTILGILGSNVTAAYQSGGKNITRNLTKGTHTFETDESTWPVNKPVLKVESTPQVSGEAEYIADIEPKFGELHGAFVGSTVGKADIHSIDPSDALKIPGVVRFIQASDIPGTNNYMVHSSTPDEIFAQDKVRYAGQPVGLIIAETSDIAFAAAKKVKVQYANVEQGVYTLEDGIKEASLQKGGLEKLITTTVKSSKTSNEPITKTITGEFEIGSQYHFQMETQIAICVPQEDGMDVYSATQSIDATQFAVSKVLNIPNNEINIQVRRLGGAYGAKISRCIHVATAAAVAAHVTNKPVKVALSLESNMEVIGKRPPYLMKYEIGVNDTGKILSLKAQIFCGVGISANEETAEAGIMFFQSMYTALGWELSPVNIITNTAPNTWCRAPGSVPGIALVENLMEHIAFELKKDPIEVRLANLIEDGDGIVTGFGPETPMTGDNLMPRMIQEMNESGDIANRKKAIDAFNKENRWKKRGLSIVPMRYPLEYFGSFHFPTYVAIYKSDGTVVVSHAGIECGQGINTKVVQAVAYELGIPVEKIKVKPTNNLTSPNSDGTGGSVTSELCVYAAMRACKELKARMAPIKEKTKPKTWEELVALCHAAHIPLMASYMPNPDDKLSNYHIWVIGATEVEVDMLTGEYKIIRADIIEDAGNSLNPIIDVGQVEGAYVMGLGYYTTEKLIYDQKTGQLLTNGTWLYKPPLPRDIPEDLRITLLKNAPNPIGILRSKATGEPPQCVAVGVLFAIKNAIYEARKDVGNQEWFRLDGPVTPEDVLRLSLTSPFQFQV